MNIDSNVSSNGKRQSATQSIPVPIREIEPGNFTILSGKNQAVLISVSGFWLSRHQHAELVWLDKKGERSIRLKIRPRYQRRISKERILAN
jgi:hypothetical protein